MQTKAEIREIVLQEWMLKDPKDRATETQLLLFAVDAANRYNWRSKSDKYQHISGWLRPYLGLD